MNLKVCLLLLVGLAICEAKIASKCPHERTLEADQCAKKGFFLLDPEYQGQQGNGVDHYCESIKSSLSCVEKFNRDCLKGFTKQSAQMGLSGVKKHYKSVCPANAPKKQEFLQKTKWITKKEIDVLYPCVQASITNMNYISETISSDNQIPQSCCNYHLTRSCLSQKITTQTNETNKKFVEQMANDSLSSLIDFLCAKQNSLKACKKEMPDAMKRMAGTFRNPGPKQKMESYLIPFLDVLSD